MIPVRLERAGEDGVFHDLGDAEEAPEVGKLALLGPLRGGRRPKADVRQFREHLEQHRGRGVPLHFVLHETEAVAHLEDPLDEARGRRIPDLPGRGKDPLRVLYAGLARRRCGWCRAEVLHELEDLAGSLNAQTPIGLPLGLVVELVARALVGKRAVSGLVLEDIRRLAADQRGLDVHDNTLVEPAVVDGAHDGVLTGQVVRARLERVEVDFDLDAEVLPDAPGRPAEVVERHAGIGRAVGDDDVAAVTAHELVEREVVEVSPVRQVDLRALGAGQAEHFLVVEPPGQPARPGGPATWVAYPEAEPEVQSGHQKSHRGSHLN